MQPAIRHLCRSLPCPNTEWLAGHGLYLPSGVGTTNIEIEETCHSLMKVLS